MPCTHVNKNWHEKSTRRASSQAVVSYQGTRQPRFHKHLILPVPRHPKRKGHRRQTVIIQQHREPCYRIHSNSKTCTQPVGYPQVERLVMAVTGHTIIYDAVGQAKPMVVVGCNIPTTCATLRQSLTIRHVIQILFEIMRHEPNNQG